MGLEGIKYEDENGNKVVESNVVILVKKSKTIKPGMTQKEIKKVNDHNQKLQKEKAWRIAETQKSLDDAFSDVHNSKGEKVTFKFNVTTLEVDNPKTSKISEINKIAEAHGLEANGIDPTRYFQKAMAAVISQDGAGGAEGKATGMLVRMNYTKEKLALPHEIGHTLGLEDNWPNNKGSLMDYPPTKPTSFDIDNIWNKAYDKKK